MSQTRVTPSSGRMSRTDAYEALQAIRTTADTFPGHPSAQNISHDAADYLTGINRDNYPSKGEILILQDALNELVTNRLMRSERQPPSVSAATVITLYGSTAESASATSIAATHAAQTLGTDVTLVDASHVRTPTLSGTRYTFRARTPADAPSAPHKP